MKQLQSLIKIKTIQLNSLNSEILAVLEIINNLNCEIVNNNKLIDSYLGEHSLDMFAMADKVRRKSDEILRQIYDEQDRLEKIRAEVTTIKQEIRAFELLIEKRTVELRKEKDRIEQNELDELNSLY